MIDPIAHRDRRSAPTCTCSRSPASDAALAFALLHVLVRDGLVDRAFLADHTTGLDELEPLLADVHARRGASARPASRRRDIERAAHLYGPGPSLLWLGQGLQRQPTGGNVMRACALLPAVTGNLGRPGAGFLYLNGSTRRGIDGGYVTGAHLAAQAPPVVSQMDLAERLADPERSRALLAWNINIAASNPQQTRLRAARSRARTCSPSSIDIFPTDTTDFADVVLPAATFLECDDLVLPVLRPQRSRPR